MNNKVINCMRCLLLVTQLACMTSSVFAGNEEGKAAYQHKDYSVALNE